MATLSGSVFLLTYWTVLVAELAGDRSIYMIASLTLRYSWKSILAGITLGFAAKMLVAVIFGHFITQIPGRWLAAISAVTLLTTATILWNRSAKGQDAALVLPGGEAWAQGGMAVSFVSIFLSEWADFGQIAAALITVQYQSHLQSWLGGTLAMVTKGILAITLGIKLRSYLPAPILRNLAAASCLALACIALAEAMFQ